MQLIYFADIFEDNYSSAELANVMKYMALVTKKQRKFQYISLAQSIGQP